jgi:leader peptidase (prepilin peptidase) / N-methyltransferase
MLGNSFILWTVHAPIMVFIFAFGACVGSFINVVIYRLPAGMSVTTPPSRCPTCGVRLRFFSENLPILGWFLVRGRCRKCDAPISPQYVLVELGMALLFLALYVGLYVLAWPPGVSAEWWHSPHTSGIIRTWPLFIAIAFMLAGLVAMTVIDARTFTIPIQIPLFITIAAFIAHPLQAFMPQPRMAPTAWPIPATDWHWFMVAAGGMIGVIAGIVLLRFGVLRYSFADYQDYVEEDQVLGDYPHARREMLVEVTFLLPCVFGLLLGWFLGASVGWAGSPPVMLQALGGSMLGYLVGGGLIWGVRILGTLAFGREAMGLGDVHLLAAIGAVLGAVDPIWVFLIAPFSGLLWHVGSTGVASMFRRSRRELPYGPHLAIATGLVLLLRPGLEQIQATYLPFLPLPGLV